MGNDTGGEAALAVKPDTNVDMVKAEEVDVGNLERGDSRSICVGQFSSQNTKIDSTYIDTLKQENESLRRDLHLAETKCETHEVVKKELQAENSRLKAEAQGHDSAVESKEGEGHPTKSKQKREQQEARFGSNRDSTMTKQELQAIQAKHQRELEAAEKKSQRKIDSLEAESFYLQRRYIEKKEQNKKLLTQLALSEELTKKQGNDLRLAERSNRSISHELGQALLQLESAQTKLQRAETRTKNQAETKLRKLQAQVVKLETDNASLLAKQTREVEATAKSTELKRRIIELEEHAVQHQAQLEAAQKEVKESTNARSQTLRIVQNAIRKRDDHRPLGAGDFPNGQMLTRETKRVQNQVCSFFSDLASVYHEEASPPGRSENEYEIIFNHVLNPCAAVAHALADEFLADRRMKFDTFIDGAMGMDETLLHLFWLSTMQKVVCSIRSGDRDYRVSGFLDEDEIQRYPYIRWASGKQIVNHEDIEGDIAGFIKTFFLLLLECKSSDPPCFLWPPVGARQSFSKSFHSQHYLDDANRAARDGDVVAVLFPGIYNGDPTKHERLEPIVEAKVVLFESEQ